MKFTDFSNYIFSSGVLDISGTFKTSFQGIGETSSIFPLALSLITFIGTSLTIFLTYILLGMISPERYKRNLIIFGQISLFGILTYIFFTPLYIYFGLQSYQNIIYIFIIHTLIVTFGTSLILEIMNNYRHILIGVYGSFIGLFIASGISLLIFNSFPEGTAKLFSLIILLPLINFSVTFFKQLFEITYYKYYLATNHDQLGDIFYQIEMEEKEELRLEEEKNMI
ncbi:MAG: hypothetical protein Q9M97_00935 [Candidatus Gracilibacteria bacterium]|nr:hypothetical protein [Candidatus Gracilibacteria bacterium]